MSGWDNATSGGKLTSRPGCAMCPVTCCLTLWDIVKKKSYKIY